MMAMHPAVLFLGTANAARSILAEAMLARLGRGAFRAYSAGSRPSGRIDAAALDFLTGRGYATDGLRSKSWDEFAGEGAPALDIVITLENRLIGEVCPVFWTGRPVSSHWPLPEEDGPEEDGPEEKGIEGAHAILNRRIAALVALPFADLDAISLQMRLDAIGRS